MKVKGRWQYLYRAVDKAGATVDFLLTAKRDCKAALRFLRKAIGQHGAPEKITIDKSGANTAAIESYNKEIGCCDACWDRAHAYDPKGPVACQGTIASSAAVLCPRGVSRLILTRSSHS